MSYERSPNNPHNVNSLLSRDGRPSEAAPEQEGTFPQSSYTDPAYQQQQQRVSRHGEYPQYEGYDYAPRDARGQEYAPSASQHYAYADAAAPQYQRESTAPRYAEYPDGYDRRDYDYSGVPPQQGYRYGYEYDRSAYASSGQRYHYPPQPDGAAGDYYYQQQQQQQYDYPAQEYTHPGPVSAYYDERRRYNYHQGSVPPQPAGDRSEIQSPDRSQRTSQKHSAHPASAYNYDSAPLAGQPPAEADGSYATPHPADMGADPRSYRYPADDPRYHPAAAYPPEGEYQSPAPGAHTQVFQRGAAYDTDMRYPADADPYADERGVYREGSATGRPAGIGITSLLADAPPSMRAPEDDSVAYERPHHYNEYARAPRYDRDYGYPGYAAEPHRVMSISQLVGGESRASAEHMPGVAPRARADYDYVRHTPDHGAPSGYGMHTPPTRAAAQGVDYNTDLSPDVPLAKRHGQWPDRSLAEQNEPILVTDDETGAAMVQSSANGRTARTKAEIDSDDDNRPLAARAGLIDLTAEGAEVPPVKRRRQTNKGSGRRGGNAAKHMPTEHEGNGQSPSEPASGRRRQPRKGRAPKKTELSREYVFEEDEEDDDILLEQSRYHRNGGGDHDVTVPGSVMVNGSLAHALPTDGYSVDESVQAYVHHVNQRTDRAVAKYEEHAKRKSQRMHEHVMQRYGEYLNGYLEGPGGQPEYHDEYEPVDGSRDGFHGERDYSRRYGNGYVDEYEGSPSRNQLQPPMMGYFTPSHPVSPRAYEHRYDRDGTAGSADSAPLALLAAEEEASGMYRDRAEHGSSRKSLFARLAIEHVPRVYRNMQASIQVRNTNMRKVVQLCQREVRRVYGPAPTRTVQLNPQQPTFAPRPPKEQLMRARRSMREMLVFWKRYEKEEREMRKRAEREAAERRKQEEEAREARRQKRKLNFLLTQTELYSHFIGSKIGGGGEDDKPASESQAKRDAGGDTTEFKDIDFDAEDDATLAAHARQSAQNALAQQQAQMREFDDVRRKQRSEADAKQGKDTPEDSQGANVAEAFDAMDFQEPQTLGGPEIAQPRMLMCELKEYQLKGLNWLANLYEQGINGILADEMGLGKTVQSISLLAYLAEKHNIWGPFMVVAPASTLHNWEQELKRFVPEFKVLPYWGSPKDRKVLRKSLWNPKSLSRKDSGFHVLVTSYQLVVTDEQYLNRVKWQYMVLDEAQAIKSSSSTRWKTLLGFHCRNRLLLTGTPIQNSMQELWALLHFIMPTLFDSHEEFSEWFSRDIEAHAENRSLLNRHQLHRLHMILKPFMLRRNKRHVQHELGEKIEHLVPCDLTQRQKVMYRGLMSKISLTELLEHVQSGSGKGSKDDDASNLMNLVMQFRKVCSHPELFERAEVDSPYVLGAFPTTGSLTREGDDLECSYATRSLVSFQMPKLVYRESLELPQVFTTRQSVLNRLSLWSPSHISKDNSATSVFSLLRLCTPSIGYACKSFTGTLAERLDSMSESNAQASSRRQYRAMAADAGESETAGHEPGSVLHALTNVFSLHNLSVSPNLAGLAQITQSEFAHSYMSLVLPAYKPAAVSPAADLVVSDRSATWESNNMLLHNPLSQRLSCGRDSVQDWTRPFRSQGLTDIWMPSKDKLIRYSGKMAVLDKLLIRLKQEGHRVLLYFQMTKMIDLFEEYLAYRKYTYLRLDGSSKIADRRDMVMDWQTRDDIFIFLLTTRAGGLGINLTAADTVIFFESDWNPTVDSQAMDRAHRMGQKKQVVVYRLITRGTVEERILQRARQKDEIHRIVIAGGDIKAAANDAESEAYAEDLSAEAQPSSKEIMSWLLDESASTESTAESERLAMARQAQITSNRIYGAGGYPGELDVSLLSHLEGDVWSQVVLLPPPNLNAMTVHEQPASAVAVESALEAAIWEQQREIEQRRREQQRQRGRGRGGRRGGGQPREKRKARASVGAKKDDGSVAGSQINTPEPTSKRIRTGNGSGVSSAAPTPVEAEAADSVLASAAITS
ncbi:putative DNA helicase ino80 [Coemansia sp. RSA 1822]|nr:putative DNA helicase ino80 [Coemansia sp. RSA 638]KAJ2560272.1 putative DNA helicase ino80 [Coemansia sp. RSA 1822]